MNDLGIKIVSVLVILLFCLSPLGAIDLKDNTSHNLKYGPIRPGSDVDLKLDAKVADVEIGETPIAKVTHSSEYGGKDFYAILTGPKYSERYYWRTNYLGEGFYELPNDLPIGRYKLYVSLTVNYDKFHKLTDPVTVYFNVTRKNPARAFDVQIDNTTFGQKPVATVTSQHDFKNNATLVYIDHDQNRSDSYSLPVKNGTNKYALDGYFPLGDNRCTVIYSIEVDGVYDSSVRSRYFHVGKGDPDLNISVNDTLLGENPMVQVNAHELLNGTANLKLEDSKGTYVADANVKIVNGVGNWTIKDDLRPDQYSIVANFSEDNNFNGSVKSVNFTVIGHDPSLRVSVDDISVGERPTVHVKANELLNGTANLKLKFKDSEFIIANTKLKITDGVGKLTIGTVLPPGNYSVIVTFDGDDTFNRDNKTADFSVK